MLTIVLAFGMTIIPCTASEQGDYEDENFTNYSQDANPVLASFAPQVTLDGPGGKTHNPGSDIVLPKRDPPTPLAMGDDTGLVPVNLLVIDPEIKNVTYLYPFLVIRDSDKENVLKTLGMSSGSEEEKNTAKESLKRLWTDYPVVFETVSNETTYVKFDKSRSNSKVAKGSIVMSEADNQTLNAVVKKFGEGATKEDSEKKGSADQPLTNWAPYPSHGEASYYSGFRVLSWDDANVLYNAADDPDSWTYPQPPSWYLFKDFANMVIHSYTHYYNPATGWGTRSFRGCRTRH